MHEGKKWYSFLQSFYKLFSEMSIENKTTKSFLPLSPSIYWCKTLRVLSYRILENYSVNNLEIDIFKLKCTKRNWEMAVNMISRPSRSAGYYPNFFLGWIQNLSQTLSKMITSLFQILSLRNANGSVEMTEKMAYYNNHQEKEQRMEKYNLIDGSFKKIRNCVSRA